MFVGHYAAAMAAKAVEPKAPMWTLAAASQLVDIGWSIFIMTGVESARPYPRTQTLKFAAGSSGTMKRPRSSVTTILMKGVPRSFVSAMTQTPASGPWAPWTTPVRYP